MARKRTTQPSEPLKTMLVKPRTEAERLLQIQIDKGTALLAELRKYTDYEALKGQYYSWDSFDTTLLKMLFSGNDMLAQYNPPSIGFIGRHQSVREMFDDRIEDISNDLRRLGSIKDQLSILEEDPAITSSITVSEAVPLQSNRVFIVHGHDGEAEQAVARFVERQGLTSVILHEQTNQGRTIIEKFEANADAGFALILLTPDDVGGKADGDMRPRARQNVIFELGFFIGRLGRNRVCALLKGDIDLPSDIQGFLYETMDAKGAWRYAVAREMREAGIAIDMNRIDG